MSDQQELRQRREALVQAVNSHDREAVLSFIHPSIAGKWCGFRIAGYQRVVRMLEQLCAPGSDYQETVAIEEIEVKGDSARLVVRRVARVGTHSQEDRAQETWRLIDGRWMMVEERQRGARNILVAVAVLAIGAYFAWGVFTDFAAPGKAGREFRRSGVPARKLEVRRASTEMVEGWKPTTVTEPETETFFYTDTGVLTSRKLPSKDHTYYLSPEVELSNEDVIGTGVYFGPLSPFSVKRAIQAKHLFWWPLNLVVSIAFFVASWRYKNWSLGLAGGFVFLLGLYAFVSWAFAEPLPDEDRAIWQVIVRFNDAGKKKLGEYVVRGPGVLEPAEGQNGQKKASSKKDLAFLVDGELTFVFPALESHSFWLKRGHSKEAATRIAKGIVGP